MIYYLEWFLDMIVLSKDYCVYDVNTKFYPAYSGTVILTNDSFSIVMIDVSVGVGNVIV